MNQTQTTTIPKALQEWRPTCDMTSLVLENKLGRYKPPPCQNTATLAVIIHNNCVSTVSCVQCFITFSSEACRRASIARGDHECARCNVSSPYLYNIVRAMPL